MSHRRLTIPKILNPANRVTPFSIPRSMNMNREKRMNANATPDREISFPANREAAYFGYASGRYTDTHCNIMKIDPAYRTIPKALTAQWIVPLVVQAKRHEN